MITLSRCLIEANSQRGDLGDRRLGGKVSPKGKKAPRRFSGTLSHQNQCRGFFLIPGAGDEGSGRPEGPAEFLGRVAPASISTAGRFSIDEGWHHEEHEKHEVGR